ncbi:hypothetical protein [Lacipirellula sp.]|uniref:hypothetical protein n=1 Tax=Lacipirellula sp. TaxID=2691419 RepID=UPI003D138F23
MALDLTLMSQAWKNAFITALLSDGDLGTPQMTVDEAALDGSGEASGIANLLLDCARDSRPHPRHPQSGRNRRGADCRADREATAEA